MTAEASRPPAPAPGQELDTPEERLARWIGRDAEIGLAAQRDELRRRLAEREREVADLRERLAHLSNAVGQLRSQPTGPAAPGSISGRAYRKLRRTAARVLRE